MIKNAVIFLIVFLSALSVGAESRIDSAAVAYTEGKFLEAVDLYRSVEDSEGTSASLLANMGNAYVRAGDYGRAMICYERSLRLDPSDKNVRNNRAYVVSKVEDANKAEAKGKKVSVAPDESTFFASLKHYITYSHTSDTWALWAGVSFLLFCVCVALYVFTSEVIVRKIGFFGGIAMIAVSIVFLIFSFSSAKACETHNEGVITGYKVSLLSEPYTNAKTTGTPLTRGTLLDILETESGSDGKAQWYKVWLNSDFAGWIQAVDFEVI